MFEMFGMNQELHTIYYFNESETCKWLYNISGKTASTIPGASLYNGEVFLAYEKTESNS